MPWYENLQVLGCACYADLGAAADGVRVAEITAIIVHSGFRRLGFGDSLLDFVEQVGRLRKGGGRLNNHIFPCICT